MNENEFSADNFFVGADSSFFFAGQARGNTSNGFIVYKYDAQSAQTLLSRIEAPKKYISEYIISFDDKNKKIIVSGFYSEQNNSSAAGVFFVSANAQDLTNSASSAHAFDDSFLSYFIGEPKTADKKELLNYRANQLVLKNDGGALLIAEARYTTTYTYFDFFTKTYVTRTMFHFDNILVFSINKDGSLDWQKSIAKKQESQEDDGYYSSYTHLVFGDNLYFLFNSFEGKLTSVILQSVTGKGEEKRSVITENSEDVALIPRAGRQIDSGVAVIPAFRKNKYLLAKISF